MHFNIGDKVKYWRDVNRSDPSGTGKITEIGELCGTAVAWIEGCSGCIALSHLEKIGEAP